MPFERRDSWRIRRALVVRRDIVVAEVNGVSLKTEAQWDNQITSRVAAIAVRGEKTKVREEEGT